MLFTDKICCVYIRYAKFRLIDIYTHTSSDIAIRMEGRGRFPPMTLSS